MKRVAATILTLISVGMFIFACVPYAQNGTTEDYWNQFRGPNGDGKATATNLPIEFSETKKEKPNDNRKSYATPTIITFQGKKQLVSPARVSLRYRHH